MEPVDEVHDHEPAERVWDAVGSTVANTIAEALSSALDLIEEGGIEIPSVVIQPHSHHCADMDDALVTEYVVTVRGEPKAIGR